MSIVPDSTSAVDVLKILIPPETTLIFENTSSSVVSAALKPTVANSYGWVRVLEKTVTGKVSTASASYDA